MKQTAEMGKRLVYTLAQSLATIIFILKAVLKKSFTHHFFFFFKEVMSGLLMGFNAVLKAISVVSYPCIRTFLEFYNTSRSESPVAMTINDPSGEMAELGNTTSNHLVSGPICYRSSYRARQNIVKKDHRVTPCFTAR